MAELFLVRHGQARFGTANYDRLSDLGEQQGRWLGEYFAERNVQFDRVLIGTLHRHRQTADAIFRGLGHTLPCEVHPGLDEYDFHSLFQGLGDEHRELKAMAHRSFRDFHKALKRVLQLWSEDRLGPTTETWKQFQLRVAEAQRAIQHFDGRRVLAVSSGGAIAVTAQQALNAPPSTAIALNLQLRNSSFCQYFFNAETFNLATFNSLPHLERPLRQKYITYG